MAGNNIYSLIGMGPGLSSNLATRPDAYFPEGKLRIHKAVTGLELSQQINVYHFTALPQLVSR